MIARKWHGRVPIALSDEYLKRMREVALPMYEGVAGNRGAWVMHRIEGEVAHFDMLSFWDSREDIKAFAGDDIEVAYYYDFDDDFLIEKEPGVLHWELYSR